MDLVNPNYSDSSYPDLGNPNFMDGCKAFTHRLFTCAKISSVIICTLIYQSIKGACRGRGKEAIAPTGHFLKLLLIECNVY